MPNAAINTPCANIFWRLRSHVSNDAVDIEVTFLLKRMRCEISKRSESIPHRNCNTSTQQPSAPPRSVKVRLGRTFTLGAFVKFLAPFIRVGNYFFIARFWQQLKFFPRFKCAHLNWIRKTFRRPEYCYVA